MTLIIWLLTAVLVVDCLLLILLVLVQLPKKEAGAGLAFGGGAADALFGAGAGNPLTQITKYAAGAFFALLVIISLLQSSVRGNRTGDFKTRVEQESKQLPSAQSPAQSPASTPAAAPGAGAPGIVVPNLTNASLSVPAVETTNAAAK